MSFIGAKLELISTSYAIDSKKYKIGYQLTLFESNAPQFDQNKTKTNGKIFTLEHDITGDGKIDVNDLEWHYLDGDGDFRSDELKKIRDEADIIITNPPFSLFREFLAWIVEAKKQFLIIGNMNAITYKEVFPLIKENKIWLGATCNGSDMVFAVPKGAEVAKKDREKAARLGYVGDYTRLGNSCWFTNLDHGRRHQALPLMTESDVIKFGTKKPFEKYTNYDAIEVPYVKYIPSDYKGVMGVPISFLDKYSPKQFEIVGMCENEDLYNLKTTVYTTAQCKQAYQSKFGKSGTYDLNASGVVFRDGLLEKVYQRILIKHKKVSK